ncbi:MAG TPA: GNAT family N-acetyltransferase [Phycisphaerae bacterium]|nr:GNAT family N-acetyltransferase [Phycisphaerae bacterium]HNU45445.1 GNAT family N-acetyltransferase [Phycisphaerae bacterium]
MNSGALPSPANLTLRDTVTADDVTVVRQLVASTGFFSAGEVEVAVELVTERLHRGPESGYLFLFGDCDGHPVGYVCYGPIACTVGSFDLYWIVTRQDRRHAGIGTFLLYESERRMAATGGRAVYVETSSRPQYEPTRRFYERRGYRQAALLPDFYAPGDGKVIFAKNLLSRPASPAP